MYLLCDNNKRSAIEQDHGLDGDTQSIIRNAPLPGEADNTDNCELFQILVAWTASRSWQPLIDRFYLHSDGRGAWLSLILTNEGTNSRNSPILKAESDISKAFWEGDRHNWTLAEYCSIHMSSQAALETPLA